MPRGSLSQDVKIATVQAMLDMGFVTFSATRGEVAERVATGKGDEGLKKLIANFINNTFQSIKTGRPVRALQGVKCYEDLVKAAENSSRTDASITRRRGRPMKATKMNPAVDSCDDIGFNLTAPCSSYAPQPRAKSRPSVPVTPRLRSCSVGAPVVVEPSDASTPSSSRPRRPFASVRPPRAIPIHGKKIGKSKETPAATRAVAATTAVKAKNNPTAPSSSNGRDYVPQSRAKSRPSVIVTSRLRSRSVGAPVVVEPRRVSFGKPLEEVFPIPPRIVRRRRCASIVQKVGPTQKGTTPKKTDSMAIGFSPAAAKHLEKNMESMMKYLLDKALKEQVAPFMTKMIESTLRNRCPDQPAEAAPAQLQAEPVVQLEAEAAPSSENGSTDPAFNASGELMVKMVEIMAKQSVTMTNCMAMLAMFPRVVSGENDVGIPSTPAAGLKRL